ncbi:glycosyl hydrolase family 16 [Flavobacterium sp. Sr18]|uniref:carbohydrate binding domain-containing protein n=1 Tax=Flavobacterium sp. Sr18 TaxID=935222 RepID=UPI0013E51C83|nr:carbohydrate binding domain-containing protein [Flavobacterium sp. Sr18]QIH38072.1 glycosyl hydrolase family 16 [Flavobacterium sp. Sr18]
MKKSNYRDSKIIFLLGLILIVTVGCERELSDDVEFATFPKTAEVFIDGFSGGLNYFPFSGSKANAFTVDQEVKYKGTASMRFDVPTVGDPNGAFAGAIFPDATGRDLSDYDALTFWIKSTQAATLNEVGLGNDFGANKYLVTMTNVPLSTNWTKVIIPIPDATKLTLEKGMFWYAEGAENGNGYTFWIDELKYEKLGTVAQPKPAIFNGVDKKENSFIGSNVTIDGLTQTYNLASGINQTVLAAPSYFKFSSSNIEVARVSELGIVTIVGFGTAKITAAVAGVKATGSLTIEASGSFGSAPVPTQAAVNVISLFSNAYTNVPVDFFNGLYDGSTTKTSDIKVGFDNFKYYSDLNYVGIEFKNPAINATTMGFLHLDIWTADTTNTPFIVKIRDRGANGVIDTNIFTGGPTVDDKEISYTVPANQITPGQWISINIPLTGDIASQKGNLAQIVFVGDIKFLLDNLYFYK